MGLPTCEQALRFSDYKQVCIATRSLTGDKPEVDIRLLSKCLHNLTPLRQVSRCARCLHCHLSVT